LVAQRVHQTFSLYRHHYSAIKLLTYFSVACVSTDTYLNHKEFNSYRTENTAIFC